MGNINQNANLYDRKGKLRVRARHYHYIPYMKGYGQPSKGNYDKMFIRISLHAKNRHKKSLK